MSDRVTRAEIRAITAAPAPGITAADRDAMAVPSYLHWNPLIRWLVRRRCAAVAAMAGRDAESVLDFGCGVGVLLPALARRARTVYAADLFPQYARELARRRGLAVTFVDGLEAIGDGALDAVVAAEVLEHLDAPEATVAAFARVLRPGGRLIVSLPTETFAYRLGRVLAGFRKKADVHRFDAAAIEAVIARAGFRRLRCRRLPFLLPPHLYRVTEWVTPSPPAQGESPVSAGAGRLPG